MKQRTTLQYARPRDRVGLLVSYPDLVVLLVAAVVLSVTIGTWTVYVFLFGFGLGDTWLINPSEVRWYWWIVPVVLIGWPVWWVGWRVVRWARRD